MYCILADGWSFFNHTTGGNAVVLSRRRHPLLFDDDDKPQADAARTSIVAPAQRSAAAKRKALTKQTTEGLKVHSFQTLLGDLATIVNNRIQPKDKRIAAFDMLTQPTVIQQRAFDLLGVTLRRP